MSDWRETTTTSDDETVALLHDEIARLEAELRARDELRINDDLTATWDGQTDYEDIEPYRARIEELCLELTAKEETIELLLEQTRFYEDSAAVQRAEWDELQSWVEDVEQRISAGGQDEGHLRDECNAERRRAESLLGHVESERRGWESQRQGMEQEIAKLRSHAAHASENPNIVAAMAALEEENRSVRKRCEALEGASDTSVDIDSLRKKLSDTLARFDASEVHHRKAGDAWAREKNELVAALAAARGEVAREAAMATSVFVEKIDPAKKAAAIEADERIRAFREHLQELHHREATEREGRGGLSGRISRLFHHKSS